MLCGFEPIEEGFDYVHYLQFLYSIYSIMNFPLEIVKLIIEYLPVFTACTVEYDSNWDRRHNNSADLYRDPSEPKVIEKYVFLFFHPKEWKFTDERLIALLNKRNYHNFIYNDHDDMNSPLFLCHNKYDIVMIAEQDDDDGDDDANDGDDDDEDTRCLIKELSKTFI